MAIWKHICSVLLTGTLMAGCVGMGGCAPQGKALDGAKLVTFGDSLTAFGSWPKSVAESCNMYLFNGAKGGITSAQALERFDSYVANREPDFVTLSFGMNDLIMEAKNKPRVSLDEYKENLRTLCEKIKALDATPILLTVSYLDETKFWSSQAQKKSDYADVGSPLQWLDQYNEKVRELAKEGIYDMVDIRVACDEYKPTQFLKDDGIHLGDTGNQVYTDCISAYLKEHFYSNPSAQKIENQIDCAMSPAEPAQTEIFSFEPTDWLPDNTEIMEIEKTDDGIAFRNTNSQWPSAQYALTKPLMVPLADSELVFDFSTGFGVKTSILLFFGDATPDAYQEGQYIVINSMLPGVTTEAGSGDINAQQDCKGSVALSKLSIPSDSIDANGNVTISAIKVYAAGVAYQDVIFRSLAISTQGAPNTAN